ncbi:hypothetical protein [Streptomyces fodineus]|uniref:hypothetical protein n=1 Tax=Streptomyces fodineus TaxID=1904616 RepID=UPI00131D72DF|nr:hypothetical protein [Streptomyces fodineus]
MRHSQGDRRARAVVVAGIAEPGDLKAWITCIPDEGSGVEPAAVAVRPAVG